MTLTVYIDSPKITRPSTTCTTFRGGWYFPSFGRRKWTTVPSATSKTYNANRTTPQIYPPGEGVRTRASYARSREAEYKSWASEALDGRGRLRGS